MNNLVTNFEQILVFAQKQGSPTNKKRGVVREYLQTKFLAEFYSLKEANKLVFVGGTCLRLLYGLDRFSEDLDFDNLGLSAGQIKALIQEVVTRLERENIEIELRQNLKPDKTYFELRFPNLLYELKISLNPKEKLMIKIDYSNFWKGQKPAVKLLNRYGFLEQIVTNPLAQILVQKLAAYVGRLQTQPRDMYDIVWLFAQSVKVDREFMEINGKKHLLEEAKRKFETEGMKRNIIRRLEPFLFNEKNASKIELLGEVLQRLG